MFNLFFDKNNKNLKINETEKLLLAKKILNLPKNTNTLSNNLIDDLEIFQGNKSDKDKSIFLLIDNTHTIFGKIYLEHIIKNPLYNINDLKYRQSIIKYFLDSTSDIIELLNSIKENENDLLWLWMEHSKEVEEYYAQNYFFSD